MNQMGNRLFQATARAEAVSRKTLAEILALNGKTVWGRLHGLDGADPSAAFAHHPVTDYSDYAPLIQRVADGEPGVLTGEPVTYFAVTSGTTGPQKLIPVTARQTSTLVRHMIAPMGIAIGSGLLGPMRGRMLQIVTEQISGTTPGGIPKGAATSGGLRKMGKMMGFIWTSPMEVIRVQDQATARYLHLLFALGEERLWTVVAFFPATLLFTLRDFHARSAELLRDLADGTISPKVELSPQARSNLAPLLRRNPARARQVARLLEQGRETVRDIWPDARAVLTATSGPFQFYADQLKPLLGDVRIFSPVYAASEAAVGFGISPDSPGYVLSPTAGYFEFLPAGAGAAERPLAIGEVEIGQRYEILLTTYAGLTRYRLGDIIRVLGRRGEAPVIEFVQRQGQVINIVGEKTGEMQIGAAFGKACREVGAAVVDYLVAPDPSATPARYMLFVEPAEGPGQADLNAGRLLELFEIHLRQEAPDYGDSVRMGELQPMAVRVLRPGAFERFRADRVANGASAAQVKVPHAVSDPGFAHRHFAGEFLA